MLNPPNFYEQSGSYINLLKRMTQRLQHGNVNDRVFETVQKSFQKELSLEKIVLSHAESDRLLRQVLKAVLTDMLTRLDGAD